MTKVRLITALTVLFGILALCLSGGPSLAARDLNAWMKGKELRIIVAFRAGGGNDLTARIIAKTGSKYFPGNPKINVVNRPGGGGTRGIRYAYSQKADGLTAAQLHPRFILKPLIGIKIKGFDHTKIRLVANLRAGKAEQLLCVRRAIATSWDDVLKLGRPITFGDTGYGTSGGAGAMFLQLVGAPVKVVTGYGGTAEIIAALDRKELDAGRACVLNKGETIDRRAPHWLKKPTFIVPIAWHGNSVDEARLKELGLATPPNLFDLKGVKYTKAQREAFELNDLITAVGNHSLWLPPGVPEDMFQAWSNMMKKLGTDAEFIKLSKAGGQDVGYVSGEKLQELIKRAQKLPKEGIDLLRRMATGK